MRRLLWSLVSHLEMDLVGMTPIRAWLWGVRIPVGLGRWLILRAE